MNTLILPVVFLFYKWRIFKAQSFECETKSEQWCMHDNMNMAWELGTSYGLVTCDIQDCADGLGIQWRIDMSSSQTYSKYQPQMLQSYNPQQQGQSKMSKQGRPVPPPPPPVPPSNGSGAELKNVSTFQAHQRELEKLDEILMANDGGGCTGDESLSADINRYVPWTLLDLTILYATKNHKRT